MKKPRFKNTSHEHVPKKVYWHKDLMFSESNWAYLKELYAEAGFSPPVDEGGPSEAFLEASRISHEEMQAWVQKIRDLAGIREWFENKPEDGFKGANIKIPTPDETKT